MNVPIQPHFAPFSPWMASIWHHRAASAPSTFVHQSHRNLYIAKSFCKNAGTATLRAEVASNVAIQRSRQLLHRACSVLRRSSNVAGMSAAKKIEQYGQIVAGIILIGLVGIMALSIVAGVLMFVFALVFGPIGE